MSVDGGAGAQRKPKTSTEIVACVVAIVSIGACNALIAFWGDHHASLGQVEHGARVRLFWHLMMGPFAIWMMPKSAADIWSMTAITQVGLSPIVGYALSRNRLALGCGALLWLAVGYFLCVAIWI
jgi:hypothetical protein